MNQGVVEDFRIVLRGDFVSLRPLSVADAATTLRWRLSPRAGLLNSGASTEAEQRTWISQRGPDELNYVIELREGKPVGMLSLVHIDMNNRSAEPARFLIGEEESCRGIPVAAESIALLYEIAFQGLGLESVHGVIVRENQGMRVWQRYFGMEEIPEASEPALIQGKTYETVRVRLTREAYETVARPRLRTMISLTRPRT